MHTLVPERIMANFSAHITFTIFKHATLMISATVLSLFVTAAVPADEFGDARVDEFVRQHCLDCHDTGSPEGGLDLSQVEFKVHDERTLDSWVRIFDRVERGEMPPPDAGSVPEEERIQFLKIAETILTDAHRSQKGTVLRRLNSNEYENTLNDLFGTNLQLADRLPPDGRTREFDTVGATLSMSMVQLRQYLAIMDDVLQTSIVQATVPPTSSTVRASYADTREAKKFLGSKWLLLPDRGVVFFQPWGYPTGMLREANTSQAGWYRVRVNGYAYQSEGPITFSIGATTFARGLSRPTFGYFEALPGEAQTVETLAWIEDRYMVEVTPYGIYDEKYQIKNSGIENYSGPGLAVNWVEIEGPLTVPESNAGLQLLFRKLDHEEIMPSRKQDRQKRDYRPRFQINSSNLLSDVEKALEFVARSAYRRPVVASEVTEFVKLFQTELDRGIDVDQAYWTAVTAIFCSPDFLYLVEPDGKLDDFSLANRLSYFLTRTLPDQELNNVATNQLLGEDSKKLHEQTERLLNSKHFERFIADFTDSWLDLREIEATMPDRTLFPEYDEFLLYSMKQETQAYLREQISANLPPATIVAADFAMLNNRLASHYGIDGVAGPQIRKFPLPANSVRGGYLSQASVLKVSSNGTNTSPVVRGIWLLERILGTHVPPPPPGVPGIEPDIRGATTLREILVKHRELDQCRGCHQLIDPPGFALESFDPVGGWRDRYRSLSNGERVTKIVHGGKVRYQMGLAVDSSGTLNEDSKFEDFNQFRSLLAQLEDQIVRNFVVKLTTFATGREPGFSDRKEIEAIVSKAIENQLGIRDLIHAVVASEVFRNK